jgi:hypothetical protein
MNIFQILLWPFTTLITKVFEFSFFLTGNYGISLILVSFFITLITAPLYILADKWKAEELTLKNKMAHSLQSINTHYTGSKKFYLTKTLQKIWGYTGLHSFKTSFGLILQIPFFFGAYEALTHYSGYQGVGFLFLQDLSKADSLFFGLALMPFIMTLVNILSAAYYSRSFSWHKNKSLYIMAAVFLVLLYKSPSALLVYWTMNNVFSILKTFVLKKLGLSVGTVEAVQVRKVSTSRKLFFKNYKQALPLFFFSFISSISVYLFSKSNYIGFYLIAGSLAIIALVLLVYWIFVKKQYSLLFFALPVGLFLVGITGFYLLKGPSHSFSKTNYAFVIIQLELLLICAWPFYKSFTIDREKKAHTSFLHFVPVFAYLFFVVFYQPVKYYFQAPLVVDTILSHFLIKMGILFFVAFTLLTIIYKLVPKQAKNAISVFFLAQLLIALIYTSILKLDTGSIDGFGLHNPKVVNNMLFIKYLIDPFIITSLFLFASYLYKNYFNVVKLIISALSIAFILNLCFSYTAYKTLPLKVEKPTIDTSLPKDAFQKHIFSTTEQNVLFIISDMSNGNYIGRMIEEEPELIDALSGFIWYPDCLSISAHTSTSMSAMHSGWDYLPHKLADNGLTGQEEIEQSMRSFFNTILENKYDTTITDLEFFTMEEKPNLHLEYSNKYVNYWKEKTGITVNENAADKTLFPLMVSLFTSSSWYMKYVYYDKKEWLIFKDGFDVIRKKVINDYAYLDLLPEISKTEAKQGKFLYIYNMLSHNPFGITKEGEIIEDTFPEPSISNFENADVAYYSTKKTIELLVKYFDWMKENKVYDNTIILIVSDHGNSFFDNDLTNNKKGSKLYTNIDLSRSQALFMVKPAEKTGALEKNTSLISNADILTCMYETGAFIREADSRPFPDTERKERYYSHITGVVDVMWYSDSPPYRTYKVTGPLADENNWEKIE